MDDEKMRIAMLAVNRWIFHSWNYPMTLHKWEGYDGSKHSQMVPRFLVEAEWSCPFEHMLAKWEGATSCRKDPDSYLTRFYAELGWSNRIALIKWVMENYSSEQKIL